MIRLTLNLQIRPSDSRIERIRVRIFPYPLERRVRDQICDSLNLGVDKRRDEPSLAFLWTSVGKVREGDVAR